MISKTSFDTESEVQSGAGSMHPSLAVSASTGTLAGRSAASQMAASVAREGHALLPGEKNCRMHTAFTLGARGGPPGADAAHKWFGCIRLEYR
jgi:hypothetical protein